MAVKKILRIGHPLLLGQSAPVTAFDAAALDTLVDDLLDTMKSRGGVGISAPQIGVSRRVIVFGAANSQRYPDMRPMPITVLINPEIEQTDNEIESDWEGCLSIPGMRGLVPRYRYIRYHGFDRRGKEIKQEAEGFHARVIQHELDHLDGILYPQRIENMCMFGFEQELNEYWR